MAYDICIVLDFDGTVVKHRYPAVGEATAIQTTPFC